MILILGFFSSSSMILILGAAFFFSDAISSVTSADREISFRKIHKLFFMSKNNSIMISSSGIF
jgi:hypothetical protein